MRRGVPCNENRFFPVRITTQGKPCSGPCSGPEYTLHTVGMAIPRKISLLGESKNQGMGQSLHSMSDGIDFLPWWWL